MLTLYIVMALFAILALGSLTFMRDGQGVVKPHGIAFFLFFFLGITSALYLIIFRVEV